MGHRIRKVREFRGLSQDELALRVGISQSAVQKIEAGGETKFIIKISEILDCDATWLQTGVGQSPFASVLYQNTTYLNVPLISWQSAVRWNQAQEGDDMKLLEEKTVHFPLMKKGSEKSYVLKIFDDSMVAQVPGKKTFLPDDLIYIDPQHPLTNGCYVVAYEKGSKEAFFRQYVLDGKNVYLRPLNPAYDKKLLDSNIIICGAMITHIGA